MRQIRRCKDQEAPMSLSFFPTIFLGCGVASDVLHHEHEMADLCP